MFLETKTDNINHLMRRSEKLEGDLNFERFQEWKTDVDRKRNQSKVLSYL
jgi:cytoplasmic iron level regulating protein YaaA (DUF328/UPF0246 family)